MFVLRVIFKSGQTLDFNFHDSGVAQRALDAITEKRIEEGPIRILDEAGRDYRFAGASILCEGLIDVDLETENVVMMGININEAGERAKRRAGLGPFEPPPEPVFEPPPPMPPLAGALESLLPAGTSPDRRVPRYSS